MLTLLINNLKNVYRDKYALIGLVAYPFLLILMAYFAYGSADYNSVGVFSVTIVNNDIEAAPDSFNLQNVSLLLIEKLDKEYRNSLIINGNNTYSLKVATDMLNTLSTDAILIIDGNFSEALYNRPIYGGGSPKATILTKENEIILGELLNIVYAITNDISLNITEAPKADIKSTILGSTYEDFTLFDLLVPGIMIGSLSICLSLLAIAIGREKESRRIHRLLTTPVKKNTILTSFIIAQIISAIIQFFIAIILSHLLATHGFGNVNWFLIFFIAMLYNLTSMGIGLILGSFVSNGRNAAIISFIITFTMMMIGENYSVPGEMAGSAFIPNTYAVDAVRNILLFGNTGWDIIGFDIIFLTLFGLITLIIGLISFNRKYAMV